MYSELKNKMRYTEIMNLTAELMRRALSRLDECLSRDVSLVVGGGGAMLLAYQFPLATSDIDAVPRGMSLDEIDPLVKQVARELGLAPDWLNPYFSTFTHTLPPNYGERLVPIFEGRHLRADALSKDDLLIMKCFAHRQKDVGHAKALITMGADIKMVGEHIESLLQKRIPGAQDALDFLDDVCDQI